MVLHPGLSRSAGSDDPGRNHAFRRPQRLTITVSWHLYATLMQHSEQQGRSLSNLACYWLERQAEEWPAPDAF